MTLDLRQRRVIVCVGSGGVGKTSVASAFSVLGARLGLKVLALTVDPAGRLADSLGVRRDVGDAQVITRERLTSLAVTGSGSLHVSILDGQRTLRELVERLAPNDAARVGIVGHPLFRYLSDYLSGANEILAMERLLEALDSKQYDLIVLDTPPTKHALDFLRGPEWLREAMRGPVLKALVNAVDGGRSFSLDWVGKRVAGMVSSFAKLTGSATLEQVATLLWELRGVFGGLGQHADQLERFFRDSSFAYVMVSRPTPEALEDSARFARALRERSLEPQLLVVNRVQAQLTRAELTAGVEELRASLDADLLSAITRAGEVQARESGRELRQLTSIESNPALGGIAHWRLEAIAGGVRGLHDLRLLVDQLQRASGVSAA